MRNGHELLLMQQWVLNGHCRVTNLLAIVWLLGHDRNTLAVPIGNERLGSQLLLLLWGLKVLRNLLLWLLHGDLGLRWGLSDDRLLHYQHLGGGWELCIGRAPQQGAGGKARGVGSKGWLGNGWEDWALDCGLIVNENMGHGEGGEEVVVVGGGAVLEFAPQHVWSL